MLNRHDYGVGMMLLLWMTKSHELACYTTNDDDTDDCWVCFVAWEVMAEDNARRLEGPIVCISTVFTPETKNPSMRHLYHHNSDYTYARVVEVVNSKKLPFR